MTKPTIEELEVAFWFCNAEDLYKECQIIKTILSSLEQSIDIEKGNKVVLPRVPTGPMLMYGIHAHEKNDDMPDIGLGPKCLGIYTAMINAAPEHEETK